MRAAHRDVDSANAIIDGEVVRPAEAGGVALIYAHRSFKGSDRRWFEVTSGGGSDCRREFPQIGERQRLFLYLEPEGLVADENGDSTVQDQILKSDRRSEYPYFPGPREQKLRINFGSKQ